MAKVDPKKVLWSGDGFAIATGALQNAAAAGTTILFTFVLATLEALTLELYLKCLLLMETGEPKRGHDLYRLFKYLPAASQTDLTHEFDKLTAQTASFLEKAKRENLPTDLESLLIRGRHSFEVFRYAHEKMSPNVVFGLKGLTVCVRKRIVTAHPDWGEGPPDIS